MLSWISTLLRGRPSLHLPQDRQLAQDSRLPRGGTAPHLAPLRRLPVPPHLRPAEPTRTQGWRGRPVRPPMAGWHRPCFRAPHDAALPHAGAFANGQAAGAAARHRSPPSARRVARTGHCLLRLLPGRAMAHAATRRCAKNAEPPRQQLHRLHVQAHPWAAGSPAGGWGRQCRCAPHVQTSPRWPWRRCGQSDPHDRHRRT
mmetsp:Transcript_3422/g.10805  ORF Transcript_3422/g.10805 Transcript_3422/m.10805 type:complete len:201 (-) Transcript_3422:56-658(-)